MNSFQRDMMLPQDFTEFLGFVVVPDVNVYLFMVRQMENELGINVRNGLVPARETYPIGSRPSQPGSQVGFPLSGHSVSEFSGCMGTAH
jgi:hypothetical protein